MAVVENRETARFAGAFLMLLAENVIVQEHRGWAGGWVGGTAARKVVA